MNDSHLDPQRAANLAENPYAGQGPVMLDIGDDVGAVVLHLPASLEGAEVEIEPADQGSTDPHAPGHTHPPGHGHDHPQSHGAGPHRPHVAVVGRPVGVEVDYSAVFPELTAGRYALLVPGAPQAVVVTVRGGEVTDTSWPA